MHIRISQPYSRVPHTSKSILTQCTHMQEYPDIMHPRVHTHICRSILTLCPRVHTHICRSILTLCPRVHTHICRSILTLCPRVHTHICRSILTSFSWLAVHHLAEAAEASSVPVRFGISKPLGASSVSAEYFFNSRGYNSTSSTFNFRPPHQNEDPQQAVLRQMHIRRAYLLSEVGVARNAPLPPDGIHLHPESKEFGSMQDDLLPEDSFDELEIESQEIPTNEGRDTEPSSSRTAYAGGGGGAYHFHHGGLDEAEILIDLDPTSSDEEYVAVPMPTLAAVGVAGEQEQSTEEIYPFAWALDGRRIGESESAVRPGSPSVPTFSLVSSPHMICTHTHTHTHCHGINWKQL